MHLERGAAVLQPQGTNSSAKANALVKGKVQHFPCKSAPGWQEHSPTWDLNSSPLAMSRLRPRQQLIFIFFSAQAFTTDHHFFLSTESDLAFTLLP